MSDNPERALRVPDSETSITIRPVNGGWLIGAESGQPYLIPPDPAVFVTAEAICNFIKLWCANRKEPSR